MMRTRSSNNPLVSSPAAGPANGTRSRSSARISVATQTSPTPPTPDPASPTSNEVLWTQFKQVQAAVDTANEGHATFNARLEKLNAKMKRVIRKLQSVKQRNKRKLDHVYRIIGKASANGLLPTQKTENAGDNSSDPEADAPRATPTKRLPRDNNKRPADHHDGSGNSDSDGNDKDNGRVRKRQRMSTPDPQPKGNNINIYPNAEVVTTSTGTRTPLLLLPAPPAHPPQPDVGSDAVDFPVLSPPAPGTQSGTLSPNHSSFGGVRYSSLYPMPRQRCTSATGPVRARTAASVFASRQRDNTGEGPSRHQDVNQGSTNYVRSPAARMSASRDEARERSLCHAKGDNEPKPPRSLRTRLYTRARRCILRNSTAISSQQEVSVFGSLRAHVEVKVEEPEEFPRPVQRCPPVKEENSLEIKQEETVDSEEGKEVEDHLLGATSEHGSSYFGRPLVRGGAANPYPAGQMGNIFEDNNGARGFHTFQPLRRDERTIEQDARGEPIINYYSLVYPPIDNEIVDVGLRRPLRRDERAIIEDDHGVPHIGYYGDYPKVGGRHHFV